MNTSFKEAKNKYLELNEKLGEDHPETVRALILSIKLAPEDIRKYLIVKTRELGLIPKDGCIDDWKPMCALKDVAEEEKVFKDNYHTESANRVADSREKHPMGR
jgi:hypothetical protein